MATYRFGKRHMNEDLPEHLKLCLLHQNGVPMSC